MPSSSTTSTRGHGSTIPTSGSGRRTSRLRRAAHRLRPRRRTRRRPEEHAATRRRDLARRDRVRLRRRRGVRGLRRVRGLHRRVRRPRHRHRVHRRRLRRGLRQPSATTVSVVLPRRRRHDAGLGRPTSTTPAERSRPLAAVDASRSGLGGRGSGGGRRLFGGRRLLGRCRLRGGAAVCPLSRPSSERSWLSRLWASTLAVACSTSSTRDSTDASLSSASRLGPRVARLDLLADLLERRHVGADVLVELSHRRVHLFLHLRLVELREQLGLLGDLLLQQAGVLLDRGLGLVGCLGRLEHQRLAGSRRPSRPGSAGWRSSRRQSCTAAPSPRRRPSRRRRPSPAPGGRWR